MASKVALSRAAPPSPPQQAAADSARMRREVRDLRAELSNRDRMLTSAPTRKFRILVLDGGGMRGVITARLLARLERKCPGFLAQADMIVGTSTGALCTARLARGDTPEDLERVYRKHGPQIFAKPGLLAKLSTIGGLAACQFSNKPLEQAMNDSGFSKMTLGELKKKVLITAFDVDGEPAKGMQGKRNSWSAKFFHNFFGGDGEVRVKDACRKANSEAPACLFFERLRARACQRGSAAFTKARCWRRWGRFKGSRFGRRKELDELGVERAQVGPRTYGHDTLHDTQVLAHLLWVALHPRPTVAHGEFKRHKSSSGVERRPIASGAKRHHDVTWMVRGTGAAGIDCVLAGSDK